MMPRNITKTSFLVQNKKKRLCKQKNISDMLELNLQKYILDYFVSNFDEDIIMWCLHHFTFMDYDENFKEACLKNDIPFAKCFTAYDCNKYMFEIDEQNKIHKGFIDGNNILQNTTLTFVVKKIADCHDPFESIDYHNNFTFTNDDCDNDGKNDIETYAKNSNYLIFAKEREPEKEEEEQEMRWHMLKCKYD